MTVTFPAVVPNPCSYCNPSARQPTSANVESPFHRSLPARTGRCELSSCALGLNSSFAQLPQRHHRHSNRKKILLVRLRSSAFDLDGDRGSLQKRFARNPASKFGVSWVSDARDSSAPQEEEEKTSFAVSRDLWPSANQHAASGSPSFNNQQTAFSLSETRPRNSKLTRRQQTRSIDSLPASRLQNRLPVFKQAAEPDAFGTSFSPVHGADAFSSCNGQSPSSGGTLTQKSASFEEASSRSGSVFTSKLEEILNKFRTRETWSSSKDESLEVRKRNGATPSATQSVTVANGGLQATRSNANESHVDSDWRIARRDVQNSGSMGSISETSADETNSYGENIFSKTVHHHKDSLRETRQGMVKGNARGLYNTGNAIISNPVESSPPSPWERQGVRSPKSKRKTNLRKSSSNFAGAHAAKSYQSSGVGNKQRSSNSESQEYPHWSTRVEKPGDIGKRSKPFSGSPNHNSDAAKDVVSEFDWTDSDEEDKLGTTSSITADDGASKRSEQLPSGSSMGVTTGKPKSLMNGNMAAWHSHSYPNLPFEFQYSYSETPKAPIIRYREEPYSPFGPDTMGRPWTGRPPLKQSKKKLPVFDSFKPPPEKKGIKFVQSPGPFPEGKGPTPARSREEILGEPLTGEEIVELVDKCKSERRQLNLGRDGLTHNMLDLIHCHWKRRRVVKVRCIGVPTVDMDNVCFHLEDKTGGKIIYRSGGSVYLFRGRNYNYKDRPVIPIMLWRPISPVYPKLIKKAPEGLTKEEADKLRLLGQKVEPLCTLGKNGVYLSLVKDVRAAFRVDDLVRINCRGLNPSDYKKIGGKLRDLVPCVLLSFDDEQILMWKGRATGSAKNVDVDDSSRMEAADCSELEDAKPSVACGVGDDEYCSAMEEIKQQALVDDTMGVSTGRSDCTILAGAEGWPDDSVATESINQMRQSTNDLCFEDFSDSSEVKSSFQSVLDAKDDVKYDKADPMPEQTTLNGGTSGIMPGHERESNTALDSQFSKSGSLMETSVLENDQMDGQLLPKAILKLDEKPTKLENSKDIGAGTKRRNDAYVVRVDALWDDAIASGIAIQLEEMDIDSDVVVKKVCELDKAVPAVAEYTRKLQTKLRIKKKRIPRPDDDLRIHFANLHKAKMEKKATKRAFRPRPAVDVPDNGGLPVDELARLLSIK